MTPENSRLQAAGVQPGAQLSDSHLQFDVPANGVPAHRTASTAIPPHMLTLVELNQQQIDAVARTVPGGALNVQDIYPLSPLQEGMLFHRLLNDQRDGYVLSTLFLLQSQSQVTSLVAALQRVIDRHDTLRSAVLWEGLPQPIQCVYRHAALCVEEIELDANGDAIEQLRDLMVPTSQTLDLQHAPLMRLQVAGAEHGACYAVLRVHHLVCDHQSLGLLVAEALAFIEGKGQHLPAPVPYQSYISQVLSDVRPQQAEAFFRTKLADVVEPTAPFAVHDVHASGGRFEEASLMLESVLARRLRIQARYAGVSAARLLHAAWGVVVAHTSGRDDIVYGTVVLAAQQRTAGAPHMLGMSVNTLPLRLKLDGVTARGLVEQTHQELVELLRFEQTPLALAQRCSGIAGTTPLFTALLNYRRSTGPDIMPSGEQGVRVLARHEAWTNYPVTLLVDDYGEGFTLTAQTDSRIDATRLASYVREAIGSLLDALEHAPETKVMRLSILPDHERRQIVESFNPMQTSYPQHKLVHELFEEQVERTPHARAVLCGEQHLTYRQLNCRANQLARYLREQGAGRNRFVGLCVERGLDMIVAVFGILKAGAAYVPLDPNYPRQRLQYMLNDTAPVVIVTQERIKDVLPEDAPTVSLDAHWSEIARRSATNLARASSEATGVDLAYVIYTSGSTGMPKGVAIEHRHAVNLIYWAQCESNCDVFEETLHATSLNFDLSVYECFVPLTSGGSIRVVRDALAVAKEPGGVTLINTVPSAIRAILDVDGIPPTTRVVNLAGEPLKRELAEQIFAQSAVESVCNLYGPTETTTYSTYISMSRERGFVGTIGRPIANTQIYILDRHQQIVPIGVIGEIYIGGAGVARGYLNRPDLTAQRFLQDPFRLDPQARMYKTGDLGRWLADGTVEYLGRNDQQVKVRGFRVELGEIETQLARHEAVKEAIVIVREDIPGDKRLVAYVLPRNPTATISVAALREHLKGLLPEHMVPSASVILERIPLTPNGKVDRRALPTPELNAYGSCEYEAPQGAVEHELANIWQRLLHVTPIGRNHHFFEIGGNSLTVMRLIVLVAEAFAVPFSAQSVFRSPTLAAMAEVIEGMQSVERQATTSLNDGEFEEGVL